MKLINIEELEIGDEIIISGNSKLKYLKVLKVPVLKGQNGYKRKINSVTKKWEYSKNENQYSSARVSIRQDEIHYKSNMGYDCIYKEYIFEQDISKHNKKININLIGRDIYLVKKEEQKQLFT